MKKIITPLIFLVVAIPFVISYLMQPSQVEVEKTKEINKDLSKKESPKNTQVISIGYDKGGFGGSRYHEIKDEIPNKTYEEILREDAERERKRALGIKENLEWLQEDIKIDYVDQEKKMVEPFSVINEADVGWDIQSLDIIDRYNIGRIKNYIPVQFKVEQMAKGGFKNKIKSLEVFSPSGKKQEFYSKEYQIEVEPSKEGINIFYFGSDGPYGAFTLYGGTERGFSGYIDHIDLGGRHLIELNREGKGYDYNIFD